MRVSLIVLCCAMVTFVLGGLMIGVWCAGLCLMADSVAAAGWALMRETSVTPAELQAHVNGVLDRFRRAA